MRHLKLLAVIGLALLSVSVVLSACGGNGGGVPVVPKTTVYRAYVVNANNQTMLAFTIGKGTGELVSTGSTTVGSLPNAVVTDPKGRAVYVANTGSSTVSAFSTDAKTGALTSAGTPTTGGYTTYVSTDPLSRFLYATNWNTNDVAVFTIDASTGALVKTDCGGGAGCGTTNPMNFAVGNTPYSNVAFDPAGKFAYIALQGTSNVARFAVDQATGGLSSSVTVSTGTDPDYVVLDPKGKFAYVANATSNDISAYTVSAADGTLAQIDCGGGTGCNGKNFAAGTYPNTLAVDPAGKYLFVANANDNTVSGYAINGATGALTAVPNSPYSVGPDAWGSLSVAVDPSGRFVYATSNQSNNVAGFRINGSTGELTALTTSPFGTGGQAYFIATTATSY